MKVGVHVQIPHLCGLGEAKAICRAGINTHSTGHAQCLINLWLLPLRTFHHDTYSAGVVENSTLGAYPPACPTVQALGTINNMYLFLLPGYCMNRTDLDTGLTAIACICDRI